MQIRSARKPQCSTLSVLFREVVWLAELIDFLVHQ